MSAPVAGLTRAQLRRQLDAEHAAERARAHACALDFLVYGDDEERGPHASRCVCVPVCSRDYDPMPYDEAEPTDLNLYEGTAIGALYDLSPMTPSMVRELAGWNLRPRSVYE